MRMLSPISTNVLEDFDRIVDSFLRPSYTGSAAFQSACNINETENHFIASFDINTFKKYDKQSNAYAQRRVDIMKGNSKSKLDSS